MALYNSPLQSLAKQIYAFLKFFANNQTRFEFENSWLMFVTQRYVIWELFTNDDGILFELSNI